MTGNPLELINKMDSELFDNIMQTRGLAFQEGALTMKEKLLIALAIDTVLGAENGVRSLATQALEQGTTPEEIMETLRIVQYIAGAKSIFTAAAALQDVL